MYHFVFHIVLHQRLIEYPQKKWVPCLLTSVFNIHIYIYHDCTCMFEYLLLFLLIDKHTRLIYQNT